MIQEAKKIFNLHEYIEVLREIPFLPDLVFRGLSNSEFKLIPGIGRFRKIPDPYAAPPPDYRKLETEMMLAFKRQSRAFLTSIPSSDFEYVAIAQHHGLPTRLLDWTKNSLAALFFAIEENEGVDGVVWCYAPRHIITEFSGDLSEVKNVSLCYPPAIVPRIVSQQGTFTIHPLPEIGKEFQSLNELIKSGETGNELIKVLINAGSKTAIRTQLEVSGVNRSTLFPDLDGLSRHLKLIYSSNGRSY